MKARWGSHKEPSAFVDAGGRGGAVCSPGAVGTGSAKSVATPGQFESAGGCGDGPPWASKRLAQTRMVWRDMPVRRSISRWLLPALSSVQMVVCRCGFKTFTSLIPLVFKGREVTYCSSGLRRLTHRCSMGQFTPARWSSLSGHKWGSLGGHQGTEEERAAFCVWIAGNPEAGDVTPWPYSQSCSRGYRK